MRFFEDISHFYGNGEKNKAGQSLEEFLDGYNAKKYDCPCNTTDIIVVRCKEELVRWGQELEVLLVKRGNHPSIGFWATPGGFVEMKENLFEGAARELEEETGVKGLPLKQLDTWGEYDRDPRWRIITTAFLALVEGDVPVKAGDDADDAVWFKVNLNDIGTETAADGSTKTIWDLNLFNEEKQISVGAKVEISVSGHKLLRQEHYRLMENNGIAADHGCLITQALLYIKEQLERN